MDLYQFLSALRARLGLFLMVLMVTVAAATVVSLVLPKTYTATVSLIIDVKDEQSLSNALRPLILPQERASYLQTQMDIISSPRVARKVVEGLNLAQNPTARASYEKLKKKNAPIEDWLVEGLIKKLDVETTQSSVIHVSFSSGDPVYSAEVANGFANAYIDTTLELRVDPTREAAEWFDEQLKGLRTNLEEAQVRLTEYYQRRGIVSAEEHLDVENTQLALLSDQVARAREEALLWKSRAQQAQEFLQEGRSPDQLPEVLDNPFIQRLKTDLLHGEARLQELAERYGPAYPDYQNQLSENRSLREKLGAEIDKVVAGIANSARQARQRETEARSSLAAQRSRVLGLKDNRNELTLLRRNVESAERAYDTAMQRSVVSSVESRAKQTNVTVLNAAGVPRKHTQPKIKLNVLLSVIVGTMLGLAFVVMIEMMDRRVRSREDVDNLQGSVPLLAVLSAWRPARYHRLLGRASGSGRALPKPG